MTHQRIDPRTVATDTGAKVNGQADHRKDTALRAWSAVYTDVDERDVLAAIKRAGIRQLARALDEGAFVGEHGEHGFTCPRCSWWAAEIASASLWYCDGCRFTGTRLGLVQLVAADAFAAIRLWSSVSVLEAA